MSIYAKNIKFASLGNPKKLIQSMIEAKEDSRPLGQIFGIASELKQKAGLSADGTPQVLEALYGVFEAMRYDTGEVITSGVLMLPGMLASVIHTRFKDADGKPKVDNDDQEFAFEVLLVQDSNVHRYTWQMRTLNDATEADPLSKLRSEMPKRPAALSAPAEITPVPEATPERVSGKGGKRAA